MSERCLALSSSLVLILLALLVFPTHAGTLPGVVVLADGVEVDEHASNPAKLYGTNGAALVLNTGVIQGNRDIQMGWWAPGYPRSLLNGDIGAGSTENPGILNVGADVSRAVRIQASGVTVFRAQAGRMKVCDERGCFDLMRALRRVQRR